MRHQSSYSASKFNEAVILLTQLFRNALSLLTSYTFILILQVIGTWKFKISSGNPTAQRDLLRQNPNALSCGHQVPDHPSTMYEEEYTYDNAGFNGNSELEITLSGRNSATSGDLKGKFVATCHLLVVTPLNVTY